MWRFFPGLLPTCAAVISLFAGVFANASIEPHTFHFDIVPEALSQALRSYGQISGQEIIFTEDLVAGKTAAALQGDYTAETALAKLLDGTGLIAERSHSGALMIRKSQSPANKPSGPGVNPLQSGAHDGSATDHGDKHSSSAQTRGGPVDAAQSAKMFESGKPIPPQEVVVTALKRSTNVQQTPLAISAISGSTLEGMGITDTDQLARATPDLVFRESANGGSRIIMRNVQAAGEPTVGLYYDETPIIGSVGVNNDAGGNTPTLRLFDLERVEVLRGPQGTLYGSSSETGTVRLIFNKPNLFLPDGVATARLTSIDHGTWGNLEQAMLNLPIVTGIFGVRAVGFYSHNGGWLNNSVLGLQHFNDSDSSGARLMARYRPIDDLTVDLTAVIQNYSGFNGVWDGQAYLLQGRSPYDQTLATRQPQSDTLRLYSGTLNWDLGPANLTAAGAYSERELRINFDYSPYFSIVGANATAGSAGCRIYANSGDADCTPEQLTGYRNFALSLSHNTAFQPQLTRNITEEIRLSSRGEARLRWTVGTFGSQRNVNVLSQLNRADPYTGVMLTPTYAEPVGSSAVTNYQRTVVDILDQYAGFAEATYGLARNLDVTAGLRYFDYRKATTGAVQVGNPVLNVRVSPATTARDSETGTVAKFNASYKWNSDLMAYASASQGFRPGGVNQVIGLPTALAPYEADKLWDYELGLKSTWLARQLAINTDIFQIDWSNIQSAAQTTTSQVNGSTFNFITNAGNVRVRGVELESSYQPSVHLVLQGSASFVIARLQGDTTAPAGITITGAGKDGDYVPYAPKVTAQISAQYSWPLSPGLELLTHADINYIGDSWTVYHRTNAYQQELPGYALARLRAGLQSDDDRWGVYLFVDNVTDKIGLINKSVGASVGPGNAMTILSTSPRTIGIDARYRF